MSRFLGEGEVTAGGQTWRLRLDMNVLADLEERTGRNPVELLAEMDKGNPSPSTLRKLCHAMLHRHHPEAGPEIAGDILSENTAQFLAVVMAAVPEAKGRRGN